MRSFSFTSRLIRPALLACALALTAFGQNTGSLSGTVQDPQGNAIAGARVTVSDPARNFQLEATTGTEGTFSFATLQPSTYNVTVEAQGFKKYVQSGIVINIADRQSTGNITLEVGSLTGETVEVTADAAQLQIKTESGEQSNAINNQQIQNLAINGRNYLDLLKLTPGVVVTTGFATSQPGGLGNINVAGQRGGKNNLTIDGTTNVDTGSNGTQHIALSLDNIAEFKILTSNYQAEYGRSSGAAIQIVTKSGTSEFHGTGFYFHRHEQFNANSYFNNANGFRPNLPGVLQSPRNFYRFNQQGYNIGGPVWLPKKVFGPLGAENLKDKLFFFWSQEWQQQLVPQPARLSRVPTALEVAGNFTQTKANGNATANDPAVVIRDPLTGQPFPGNIIPANRIDPNGQKILQLFRRFENLPFNPNGVNGYRYNHDSQLSVSYPRRENSIRVDYNASENTRMYIRYTRDADQQIMPYGLGWTGGNNQIPFDNLIFRQAPAWNGTLNVTQTLSPTLTNEFIFGTSQNNLTLDPSEPNAATYSGIGFNFATPFPYPPNQWFNITFGGIPNQNFGGTTGYGAYPYKNSNTTFNLYDNVSKVIGTHTAKAGFYFERSRKDQVAGNSATIAFSNEPNNPNNTGHPYANALLGFFNTYQQPNIGIIQGQYRYSNYEWYIQDNWKVNSRLTLDYGMRFSWVRPQFDKRYQDYYFVPERFNAAQAVRLYRPTCAPGTFATNGNFCTASSNQRAFDPANPNVLLPAYLIGRTVPGSGNPFNGQTNAKDYYPGGIKDRGVQYGPAFGFAWDVFGTKRTVVRGGYRLSYDRVQGNELAFAAVGQPPLYAQPTFNFGSLATVGQGAGQSLNNLSLGTSGVIASDPEGYIPSTQSFSLQVQQDVGWNTVFSVGYVGTLSRHQQELLNLNYIPYGTLFTKAAQDPSRYANGVVPDEEPNLPQIYKDAGVKFSGQFALQADFLRKYPGYNTVGLRTFGGSANYHSLQATLSKRFARSVNFGLAYTYSKAMGTANGYTDWINPVCSRCADYRRLAFDRTHVMVINYDWQLPKLQGGNWLTRGVLNGWQVTGITQFLSGQPEDVSAGIAPSINLAQRLAGTWDNGSNTFTAVRGYFTGDPQTDPGREKYFNYENIRLPSVAEALAAKGAFPRNFLVRPGINVTDLSVFKNFAFGGDGQRNIQLRVEAFNVFNHAQFSDMNRSVTWNSFAAYLADRQASAANIQNVRANLTAANQNPRLGGAVGEVNALHGAVSGNRVVQLAVKIFF
jgi:hypothetical protein